MRADRSHFAGIGGILVSSPVAQLWKSASQLRVVVAQGRDGQLRQGTSPVGSATWTWARVPLL